MKKVLVTGCLGQIGSELVLRLREDLGNENVVATDIRMPEKLEDGELFEILDVMDYEKMRALVEKYQVDTLIHLAALLSAVAEAKPKFAWDLNMVGLVNALEVAVHDLGLVGVHLERTQNDEFFLAVQFHVENGSVELFLLQVVEEFVVIERDGRSFNIVPVDDARDLVFATQAAARTLTLLFTYFCVDSKH